MKKKNELLKGFEENNERIKKEKAAQILADFENRREERRQFELNWQLNINFVAGNQFCYVSHKGEVDTHEKDYFWQEREVYNHLAPIIETRLAKLGRVRPVMKVMPFSGDDDDLYTAKMSTGILTSACSRIELDSLIAKASLWSEVCGTVFYKVLWNPELGKLYNNCHEGDVEVCICPPFEIFPDRLSAADVKDCRSIIHARAFPVDEVREAFGVEVSAQDVDVFNFLPQGSVGSIGLSSQAIKVGTSKCSEHCLVIERYTAPSKKYKKGRLEIVAGGELVFEGDLPYKNGDDQSFSLPFVRQVSIESVGSFFGVSVLERLIPIQRAFNAVKNRKHEFMNRISVGVLAVEDGSVDMENLETEGLSPGKILVYRQGARPPQLMNPGSTPVEFAYEEDRLLNEFTHISGVSEIMRNSQVPSAVSSGVALALLVEQDDTRLSVTAEFVRNAVRMVSQHILRLYKQFASTKRLARIAGEDGIEVICWSKSDIGGDDIVFVTENELNETPSSRRNMVFELLKAGLLHDENGKLSNGMRAKVLDLLGYGLWEEAQDIASLHVKRAATENIFLSTQPCEPKIIDDHDVHLREHARFMLGADFDANDPKNAAYFVHVEMHKQMMEKEVNNAEIEQ